MFTFLYVCTAFLCFLSPHLSIIPLLLCLRSLTWFSRSGWAHLAEQSGKVSAQQNPQARPAKTGLCWEPTNTHFCLVAQNADETQHKPDSPGFNQTLTLRSFQLIYGRTSPTNDVLRWLLTKPRQVCLLRRFETCFHANQQTVERLLSRHAENRSPESWRNSTGNQDLLGFFH